MRKQIKKLKSSLGWFVREVLPLPLVLIGFFVIVSFAAKHGDAESIRLLKVLSAWAGVSQ